MLQVVTVTPTATVNRLAILTLRNLRERSKEGGEAREGRARGAVPYNW
jgi:hypothetical protein